MSRTRGFVPVFSEYIKAGTAPAHYPATSVPEIAFVGRSMWEVDLDQSVDGSERPRSSIEYTGSYSVDSIFCIAGRWVFADLPGYGFAKVPPSIKRAGPDDQHLPGKTRDVTTRRLILDIRQERAMGT